MQSVIRIGSRESRLAVKQAEIIKDQIRRCDQTILVEIITMTRLWETDNYIEENTLTVNIARLRRKLDKAGLTDFISTKVGEGYIIRQERQVSE